MRLFFLLFCCSVCYGMNPYWSNGEYPDLNPRNYVCLRASSPITIDGDLNDEAWQQAPWTESFMDIQGEHMPKPDHLTRAKMLWDDDYFYVAAELIEPHIWGYLTQRDTVIYHDNDFEVFIDPNGDTHGYYELEVNALNTVWDLLLIRPYRDGGPPIDNWDINGLKTAVKIYGTLNDPSDIDEKWTVEIAIPMSVLREYSRGVMPSEGVHWWVNFSRVHWHTEIVGNHYHKMAGSNPHGWMPEENWVWSPQGAIDMHRPEMWGLVQFSDSERLDVAPPFVRPLSEDYKWELRNIYYAQRLYRSHYGEYASALSDLERVGFNVSALKFSPQLKKTWGMYEVRLSGADGFHWSINQEGRTWRN